MVIKPYEERYRDDLIFMVLQAKDALGRIPRLNEDLLHIHQSYFDQGDFFWIAVDEHDRVVGSIGYSRIPHTTEAFLHRLYVKASEKRKGIGSALLATAERAMQAAGLTVSHVHLGSPPEQWFESYSFYPKHGYREYRPGYMRKELYEIERGNLMDQTIYNAYVSILNEELLPAMGCTEPIAVAYAAAVAARELGKPAEAVEIRVSGNIIKNVKSVVVPNTGGLRGLAAAAAAGIVAGDADKQLEVISTVSDQQHSEIAAYMKQAHFTVVESDSGYIFDIDIVLTAGSDTARCRIAGFHTNIIRVEKNGEILVDVPYVEAGQNYATDRSLLNIASIVEFADKAHIEDVKELLDRQIEYNMAISRAGLEGNYGARIGQVLLASYGNDVHNRAKAYAAAASDARMNGCSLPVVINSGSGNQGITCSVPVIVYAEELGASDELRYRALLVSNLITTHLKTGIGRLSAYCGAISAGVGAGAGITYLYGGKEKEIAHTIVNALAIDSGIICDGAKSSCAAKIASAVEGGLLGMEMYRHGSQFYGGDGIVTKGVENTIRNVGRLARIGMAQTDKEIIDIMISDPN